MDEELLNDQQYRQLNPTRQYDLITKYCAGIEEKIRRSASLSEAENIVSIACKNFEDECSSNIIQNALVLHLQNLVNLYWEEKINARTKIQFCN